MSQLFSLDEPFQDLLPLCLVVGGVVLALAEPHMRNHLPEDMVVRGLLSDMMSTAPQLFRAHDHLCALARIHAHGPHQEEAVFA